MDKFTILNKLNLLEAFSLLYTYIYIYIFVNELKHIPRIFLPLFRFIFFFFFFFTSSSPLANTYSDHLAAGHRVSLGDT